MSLRLILGLTVRAVSGLSEFERLRAPLTIHFGEQANPFDSGRRQEKAALVSTKADSPSLPEFKKLLLVAQKQLLELPLNVARMALVSTFSLPEHILDTRLIIVAFQRD
ncbi:hypothetical protein ACFL6U_06375 [Planctomycetota bacterium]